MSMNLNISLMSLIFPAGRICLHFNFEGLISSEADGFGLVVWLPVFFDDLFLEDMDCIFWKRELTVCSTSVKEVLNFTSWNVWLNSSVHTLKNGTNLKFRDFAAPPKSKKSSSFIWRTRSGLLRLMVLSILIKPNGVKLYLETSFKCFAPNTCPPPPGLRGKVNIMQ